MAQLIYVGPSLPDGSLRRFTVFRGELPAHVQNLLNKKPALSGLFVTPTDLQSAKARVAQQGDPLHTLSLLVTKL